MRWMDERAGCDGWEHLVPATRAEVEVIHAPAGLAPAATIYRWPDTGHVEFAPTCPLMAELAGCWREAWAELDAIDFTNGLDPGA